MPQNLYDVLLSAALLPLVAASTSAQSLSINQDRLAQKPLTPLPSLTYPEIHRWLALGDSYAAGLGAGSKLPNWDDYACSRYNSSYPYLLHTHPAFNSSSHFDFLACSGATTSDVLSEQLPQLKTKHVPYDLITLSAGGNDVHLADVLNACIFQWSGGTSADCDAQLATTERAINKHLGKRLDKLLAALVPLLSAQGKIYQTSYARFFEAESAGCENVTWAFWYAGLGWWEKQYLTRERRAKMNALALRTNVVIAEAVARAGERVEFVEFDGLFEKAKGRFCEDGVEEPAPNREGLLFYEWDTVDGEHDKWNGTVGDDPERSTPGTFERRVKEWIREGRRKNPDGVSMAQSKRVQQKRPVHAQSSSDVIPDGYMRVFHPRPAGHVIMAAKLIEKMGLSESETGKRSNWELQREEL